jgi:hypothetical protein
MKFFQDALDDANTAEELLAISQAEAARSEEERQAVEDLRKSIEIKNHCLWPTSIKLLKPGENPQPGRERTSLDVSARNLVDVLERKGWSVPGVDIKLAVTSHGDDPIAFISRVSGGEPGSKWLLRFNDPRFQNSGWTTDTSFFVVNVPGQKMIEFHSKATLYRYAGNDWRRDEKDFWELRGSSRTRGEKRIYLVYRADGDVMVNDTDEGREYAASGDFDERTIIPKAEMFDLAADFINEIAEDIDATCPETALDSKAILNGLLNPPPIPVPPTVPDLVVIEKREGTNSALVSGRYHRLCSSVDHCAAGRVPERALGCFSYGFPSARHPKGHDAFISKLEEPDTRITKVALNKANDIWVADLDAYCDNALTRAGEPLPESDKAYPYFRAALTMVPLTEDWHKIKNPFFLIGRPLGASEAQEVTEAKRREWNIKVEKPSRPHQVKNPLYPNPKN